MLGEVSGHTLVGADESLEQRVRAAQCLSLICYAGRFDEPRYRTLPRSRGTKAIDGTARAPCESDISGHLTRMPLHDVRRTCPRTRVDEQRRRGSTNQPSVTVRGLAGQPGGVEQFQQITIAHREFLAAVQGLFRQPKCDGVAKGDVGRNGRGASVE
jgi:hypothetical protein